MEHLRSRFAIPVGTVGTMTVGFIVSPASAMALAAITIMVIVVAFVFLAFVSIQRDQDRPRLRSRLFTLDWQPRVSNPEIPGRGPHDQSANREATPPVEQQNQIGRIVRRR